MNTKKNQKNTSTETKSTAQKNKSKKKIPFFSLFLNVFQVALVLALLLLALGSFGARIPVLQERGISFYAVTSGSMEPFIPVGSMLYVANSSPDDLKENDIITYLVPTQDSQNPAIVTHRITRVIKEDTIETYVDPETNEPKEKTIRVHEFATKGDANRQEDSKTVPTSNVLGVYKWHVPYLGYVTGYAQTLPGFLLLVIVPGFAIIIWELFSLFLYFKNREAEKSKNEVLKLKAELEEERAKNVKS